MYQTPSAAFSDLTGTIGMYIQHLDIYWRVCSDSGDRQIQSRQAILVLNNLGGELDAGEVAVGAVVGHNFQVASHGVAVPRLHRSI